MRSRFAAFALNEADYLWHTLAPEHVDRQQARETVLRGIRESASRYRYRSLSILDTRQPDPKGVARVLFLARVFRDGQEVSFVELSEFTHDGVGWRYAGGTLQPVEDVAGDPAALRIATFQS
jgi:SEC-C motif-containing protein